jgi:hypothetical protein
MHPILASRARLGTYLLGWVPIALMLVGITASQRWPVWEAVVLSLPLCFLGAMLFLSSWYLCRAMPLATYRFASHGLAWFLAAALMGNLWYLCAWGIALLLGLAEPFTGLPFRTREAWAFFFAVGIVLYLAVLALHYLLDAAERGRDSERREQELRVLARDAELKALRAQLNPHFLFNSLNSISALTTIDPSKAREMCVLLSDFLRKSLKLGERMTVSLGEELDLAKAYLAIERIRFGERLSVEWEVEASTLETRLPTLLLQPLVENAIKHGIAAIPEGGRLGIAAAKRSDEVEIVIENPVDPDSEAPVGLGMGLRQVRQRLLGRYGSRCAMEAGVVEGVHRVALRLPLTWEKP